MLIEHTFTLLNTQGFILFHHALKFSSEGEGGANKGNLINSVLIWKLDGRGFEGDGMW
jgi:hypothetical protein